MAVDAEGKSVQGKKPVRKDKRVVALLVLHIVLLVYSLTGIFGKMAAAEQFLSLPFLGYYAGVIILLGIYALAWQQVIKHLPLTTAFANKAVTVLWGMLWGILLFGETMNIWKIAGAVLVVAGVVLFVIADDPGKTEPDADDELVGEGL